MPKHAIIALMTILNKLPTKDRLISWGLVECVLCQHEMETSVTCFLAALSLEVFGRNSYNFVALGGRFQTGHNSESVMRVPRKSRKMFDLGWLNCKALLLTLSIAYYVIIGIYLVPY